LNTVMKNVVTDEITKHSQGIDVSTNFNDSSTVALQPSTVGSKVLRFPTWPSYAEDEVAAAASVLRSGKVNYWTGDDVRNFELALEVFSGHKHAIALANGTIAIDFALAALGVGDRKSDEVICTSRSFVASASCALRVGAKPVFADVDVNSQNMTPETIAHCITPQTKAVVVVHLAGWPCDMEGILDVCDAAGIPVIEDCAQAHGATINGQPVGSFGRASTWSFCQDKIITTGGEGGCVTTNDTELYESLWTMKEHGKSYGKIHDIATGEKSIGYKWLNDSIGTNGRMTGFQAAIGQIQLSKLSGWSAKRNANANYLWSICSGIDGLRVPRAPSNMRHACYLGYVFVDPKHLKTSWSRDRIMGEIIDQKVPVTVGSCPELYREAVFHSVHDQSIRLPVAQQLGGTSMAFPVHPSLGTKHLERMCSVITDTLASAVR
jgi:dTDP-4-amino-4,6-dideoxygalactose transaminase